MGTDFRDRFRADLTGAPLAAVDPRDTPGLPAGQGKSWARGQFAQIGSELARQQEMLYAQAQLAEPGAAAAGRRVLLVLQGMDCSGKGGAARNVGRTMNPVGLRVAAFGPPTEEELRHHFLWRVTRALPAPGRVGIFDRSHYEDVLVVRVRRLAPETVWQGRYDEINAWEADQVANGTSLVKVLLHLSYEEQTERLAARLDNPDKHWKYHPSDVDDRQHWDAYQAAYADAVRRCHTDAAPWYVVPADRKWYRDWVVANLLLASFRELGLSYPAAGFDLAAERRRLARSAIRSR